MNNKKFRSTLDTTLDLAPLSSLRSRHGKRISRSQPQDRKINRASYFHVKSRYFERWTKMSHLTKYLPLFHLKNIKLNILNEK